MKKISIYCIVLCLAAIHAVAQGDPALVQFVFTSDVHYGLFKHSFRGKDSVASTLVNEAMIGAMNHLPGEKLPGGTGVGAGKAIGYVDVLTITGDIANREEKGVQSATASWEEFQRDYTSLLKTRGSDGRKTRLALCAGNHDVANALGSWRPMDPARDAGALVGMYNLMMRPGTGMGGKTAVKPVKPVPRVPPVTVENFDYARDKVHYSFNLRGIHFLFVNCWPDSAERIWIESDLDKLPKTMPVLLFTHSMPYVEARFFTNPNGDHSVNDHDKFENLLPEVFKDGDSVEVDAVIEQRALVEFLRRHTAIRAWFHGHANYTQYYDWDGPDSNFVLHCFRTDSPMKGRYSADDEGKLAFEVVTIDPVEMKMTVRERLWNAGGAGIHADDAAGAAGADGRRAASGDGGKAVEGMWGQEKTISIRVP